MHALEGDPERREGQIFCPVDGGDPSSHTGYNTLKGAPVAWYGDSPRGREDGYIWKGRNLGLSQKESFMS